MLQLKNLEIYSVKERWLRPAIKTPILNNVNLELKQGELLALVGGSGEGKSLLLQSIMGLLPSSMGFSGEIAVDGQNITSCEQTKLRGNTLGYIPQSVSALNPLVKVGKQITRAAKLGGNPTTHAEIVERLKHYGLTQDIIERYPLELSGGMAKRVLVSCATLNQARFILADEVTSWLDNEHAMILLDHLKALCRQNRGVLWITHDLHLAAHFADRVAVLHNGTINEIADADKLRTGECSPWLRSLWQALPEHQFIRSNVVTLPALNKSFTAPQEELAYAGNA